MWSDMLMLVKMDDQKLWYDERCIQINLPFLVPISETVTLVWLVSSAVKKNIFKLHL